MSVILLRIMKRMVVLLGLNVLSLGMVAVALNDLLFSVFGLLRAERVRDASVGSERLINRKRELFAFSV